MHDARAFDQTTDELLRIGPMAEKHVARIALNSTLQPTSGFRAPQGRPFTCGLQQEHDRRAGGRVLTSHV